MGDVILPETDEVAVSFSNGLQSTLWAKPIVADNQPVKVWPEGLTNILDLLSRRDVIYSSTIRVFVLGLGQFNKADAPFAEFLQEKAVSFNWSFVEHVLDSRCGGKFDAYLVRLKVFEGDIDDFQGEPYPILGVSSVLISPSVGVRPEEFIDEVSECTVKLNTVEACFLSKREGVVILPL